MTKAIVITGASGLVGKELVRYFSEKGYEVRALVRNPKAFSNTKNVSYYPYDLAKKVDGTPFKNADYLVHTAYTKSGENVLKQNVDAAKSLLKISRANKLKRNVFISSMSADENAPGAYGRQKYQIEQLFTGKNDTVIRSSLVIGEGGLAHQIIDFMSTKHVAPLIDGGKQPIQFIAIQDLAKVIDTIIEKGIGGQLYIGTPRIYTYKEFYQTVKKKKQIKALLLPVPYFIPLLAIRLIRLLRLPLAVTEDNLKGLRNLKAYDTKDDVKKVGVTLQELEEML